MTTAADDTDGAPGILRVINLSDAPGARASWDRPRAVVLIWAAVELLFVTNPWQVSSSLRISMLRLFGAEIGEDVIFRPRTRVKFPWKLHIGDRCWIGEGVWFHNQDHVRVGRDVVISQETMLTTGSHAHRRDMALLTKPIVVADGVWITSRCMILGGTTIGQSSLVKPMSVVSGTMTSNAIIAGNPATAIGHRFTIDEGSN
jgi:putative colanic acid biosynthesis acetyltransferase WcaF